MVQTGSEWLASLPENSCPERDQALLQAASDGLLHLDWVEIESVIGENVGRFSVLADAAYVLLDDGYSRFRPQVSASIQQKIADILDVSFCTAKVCDLAYIEAGKSGLQLNATLLQASSQMSDTSVSKHWNELVDGKRNGFVGLTRDIGKAWIIGNSFHLPDGAINYGFYDRGAPNSPSSCGLKGWQLGASGGHVHNNVHQDYSQIMLFMKKSCQINGQDSDLATVFADPALSHLVSYEGVLHYTRQP